MHFLGHHLDATGTKPLPEKVRSVQRFSQPSTAQQLQRFLEMMNFYHRFLSKASFILQPLHALANKKAPVSLQWSDSDRHAFNAAKTLLASAATLSHPEEAPLVMFTDASDVGIRACLEQWREDRFTPLGW